MLNCMSARLVVDFVRCLIVMVMNVMVIIYDWGLVSARWLSPLVVDLRSLGPVQALAPTLVKVVVLVRLRLVGLL